jgi:hypothetical protein
MRFTSLRSICSLSLAITLGGCGDDAEQVPGETVADADVGDEPSSDATGVDALAADAQTDAGDVAEDTVDEGEDIEDGDAEGDQDIATDAGPDTTRDVAEDIVDVLDTSGLAAEVLSVRIEDNEINGLSPWVDVTLSDVAPLRVVAQAAAGDARVWDSEAPRDHYRFLMPLTPDQEFTLSIEPQGGASVDDVYETAPLPDDFPPIEVGTATPGRDGFTLFNVYRFTPDADYEWGMAIVVDDTGEPVWFYRADENIQDIGVSRAGNLIYGEGNLVGREITWSGVQVASWEASGLGVDTIHHEFHELDDGDLLFLSTELRTMPDHPSAPSGQDGNLYTVGDVVVRASRDGNIETSISTFDFLDPYEDFGPSSTLSFWDRWYWFRAPSTADWTHGNSVIQDPYDGHYIVSLRHMDLVVKLHSTTGEPLWQLGPGGDLTPAAGTLFPSHQHAPFVTGPNRLMVYDNGNRRAGDAHTRVVEYSIGDGTVEQTWEYRGVTPYLAPWVGDADITDDATVLIADGGLLTDPSRSPFDSSNQKSARIREVTFDGDQEIVFELSIHDESAENPTGYMVYRADRLSHLGPSL